jgi:bifunctional DNA-binding transcriptional regulator/antitoxin component of YhaV-PrlF toxin-antitoxin module
MAEPFSFSLGCRKIYTCGRGTPVIALPKLWRENYGVKTGDSVSIEVLHNGDMLVKPPEKSCRKW